MPTRKRSQSGAKKGPKRSRKRVTDARGRSGRAAKPAKTRHPGAARSAARARRAAPEHLRVLFTCVGRRIELIQAFRRAAEQLGLRLEVHGADASGLSPGLHRVDRAHRVPAIDSGEYIDALVDLARRRRIDMLIPLIDTELALLANAVDRFAQVGCRVVVSSPRVVAVCRDKLATFSTLSAAGIDTPRTWAWEHVLAMPVPRFPYFLKPRRGSAAQGNHMLRNDDDLRTLGRRVTEPIVQEFVEGIEHTVDVYAGLDGVPQCAVPRRRLEVRSGEVSKSLIVKDPNIMDAAQGVVDVLGECRGVVTVQCIRTNEGRVRVIEINPRFGGGVPLSIHAGADFPRWILQEHLGRKPRIKATDFRDDVAMLRYDESVFVPRASRFLSTPDQRSTGSPGGS